MPVRGRDADFNLVFAAIRLIHPDVPIFVFGEASRESIVFNETER
jgi:hypothetical protein